MNAPVESHVYKFGTYGRYMTTEWRMGIREIGSGDTSIVIADEKVYSKQCHADKAAGMKNRMYKRNGWEYVAVRVELRLVEVGK